MRDGVEPRALAVPSIDPSASADACTMLGLALAIAHCVSGPLTAIAAEAEALKSLRGTVSEQGAAADRLARISSRAMRDVQSVQSLLRLPDAKGPVAINRIVAEITDQVLNGLDKTNHGANFAFDESHPLALAMEEHVIWILREVLTNAAEAGTEEPDDLPQLSVSTIVRDDEIIVEIACVSAPIANLERIFDMFTSSKSGHAGVGLGIARALAVANGGRLWASSSPGKTHMMLMLPLFEEA